jgi:uncharacterized damage-inducible protein DinB
VAPGPPPGERVPFILAHVVNHGTQHRSEMARYLTRVRDSPDDLDLIAGPYLAGGEAEP